jgi:hypothetical protein
MRRSTRRLAALLTAATLGAAVGVIGAPALAKSALQCRADYAANKETIKAGGQTEKAYLAACEGAPAAPAAAPAANAATVVLKTKAQCSAEYTAHVVAIKANGQSKAAFDADCRAGIEKTERVPPAPVAAAPTPPVDPIALKPSLSPAPAATKP